DCGIPGHRHLAKLDALRCLDNPPAPPLDPVEYADPGYQPDGQKRYPIDSDRHIRAAWAYIHQPRNAGRYTPEQFAAIKERIIAPWQARIDPAGPPEATSPGHPAVADLAAKGIVDIGDLAEIVLDLDQLRQRLLVEAAVEGDNPEPAQILDRIVADLR